MRSISYDLGLQEDGVIHEEPLGGVDNVLSWKVEGGKVYQVHVRSS